MKGMRVVSYGICFLVMAVLFVRFVSVENKDAAIAQEIKLLDTEIYEKKQVLELDPDSSRIKGRVYVLKQRKEELIRNHTSSRDRLISILVSGGLTFLFLILCLMELFPKIKHYLSLRRLFGR